MKHTSVILLLAVGLTLVNRQAVAAETDNPLAQMICDRIFDRLDKDGDGVITREEAKGVGKKHFDKFDADSDGRVTPAEVTAVISARMQQAEKAPSDKETPDKPARQAEFKRPQARHRTSRPVPTPWLGYGHDDHPEIRGATYLKKPDEIRTISLKTNGNKKLRYPKGSGLRIVATGHSWMWPGYRTLPKIAEAAGLDQQLRTNTRGGEAGAARMMWELENGILSSKGKPNPVCMAAITTGQWDAMMWGCYRNDRPQYYFAWIDFCLKYNPKMEFYVFNAWPQYAHGFADGDREPRIENYRARAEQMNETFTKLIADIDKRYPDKVHILPTCDAMMAAIELYFKGELPGVNGLNRKVDGASPAIWSDGGHLGAGMDRLEGYVFYATLYKKSPELIEADIPFHNDELDKIFRKIAWQAVVNNRLSDVTDKNGNGIGDEIE